MKEDKLGRQDGGGSEERKQQGRLAWGQGGSGNPERTYKGKRRWETRR